MWTFNLIPQPGDPGHDTWTDEGWKTAGGTNVWGLLSLDAPNAAWCSSRCRCRGTTTTTAATITATTCSATRVVALDTATGKLQWHQQLVHHDIWDYDLGAAPTLVDVRKDGRTIPAVAQITKMGLLFVFDRDDRRAGLAGSRNVRCRRRTAPGEKTSPTQPFPVKPPPLARNSMQTRRAGEDHPEHNAYCAGLWDKYKLSDTVPYSRGASNRTSSCFPGAIGGGNWNGVTYNRAARPDRSPT